MKKLFILILFSATMLPVGSQVPDINGYPKENPRFELPKSAEKLLIERVHAESIIGVNWMTFRRHPSFDYLGVNIEFAITWGFEGVYHQNLVLRKKTSQADWSEAEVFDTDENIFFLFGKNEERDLLKGLIPRKKDPVGPAAPHSPPPLTPTRNEILFHHPSIDAVAFHAFPCRG